MATRWIAGVVAAAVAVVMLLTGNAQTVWGQTTIGAETKRDAGRG